MSEALSKLTRAGVLLPDDNMEDHVRKLFKLPEAEREEDIPEREEKSKKEPKEEVEASEKVVAFESWRPLTFAEQKMNFADIKNKMDEEEKRLKGKLKEILKKTQNSLLSQIQRVLEEPDSAKKRELVKEMSVKYQGEYKKEVFDSTKRMFEYGKMMAAHEMKKQPPATPDDKELTLKDQVEIETEMMSDDLMKEAKRALLNSLRKMADSKKVWDLAKISLVLGKAIDKIINNVPSVTVGQSFNQGRRLTFDTYSRDIYALQRSEILDEVTCNYCLSIDGRVFSKDDPFADVDLIHTNCRGIFVEILMDEKKKPPIKGMPQGLRDRFESINEFEPPRNPVVTEDSLAAKKAKEVMGKEKEERLAKIKKYKEEDNYPNRIKQHQRRIKEIDRFLDKLT